MQDIPTSNLSVSDNSSANDSDVGFYPNAKPAGVFLLLIAALTVLANGVLILAYLKRISLHTPFNIYLINLSITDCLQALLIGPGYFALFFTNRWALGRTYCTIYLYAVWTLAAQATNIHLLISLNRLWAVTFPVSYKRFHNKRVAVTASLLVWVYAHVWTLPGVIPDALYYREDSVQDCSMNYAAQPVWSEWVNLIPFDTAGIAIVLVYPVIAYKIRGHRKISGIQPKVGSGAGNSTAKSGLEKAAEPDHSVRQPAGTSSATMAKRASLSAANNSGSNRLVPSRSRPGALNRPSSSSYAHFKILSLLVCGAIACWTPLDIYYTVSGLTNYSNFTFYYIASVLYYFDFMLNPILYPLATTEWRRAVLSVLPTWH